MRKLKVRSKSGADVKTATDFAGTFMAQPAPDVHGTALQVSEKSGGGGRNRTGVHGFAVGSGESKHSVKPLKQS